MQHSPNHLLASLSATDFADIEPLLKTVPLVFGDVLSKTGTTIENIYFPHSGIVSLVVEMTDGDMIETAMTGRDGVWGAVAVLDGKLSVNKALVQLAGTASVITADALRRVAEKNTPLRSLLLRHEQFLLAQAQQSAACNAKHNVEPRMCRWLLRMRDVTGQDDLDITQEFLGQMMGVRRTSVSLVASALQEAGLIRYRRGHVHIRDVDGLGKVACECHGVVKAHYARLILDRALVS